MSNVANGYRRRDYFDKLLNVMNYHNERMQNRRSLSMKAFTGVVVLYLVMVKGYSDLNLASAEDQVCLIWLIRAAFALIFLLFTLFMFGVESVNQSDRLEYANINSHLHKMLRGENPGLIKAPNQEQTSFTLWISWAGTWPILTALLIAILCGIVISYL